MSQIQARQNQNLPETLMPIFGQPPNFFSDSSTLINWLRSIGCKAFEFGEISNLSIKDWENAVLITMNEEAVPTYREMDMQFRNSRVLIIPMMSFDASIDAAIYTMKLSGQSDIEAACHLNEKWMNFLLTHEEPFIFSGKGCELTCEVNDDARVLVPKTTAQLAPGEWMSIGSYFEVGMVPQAEDFQPSFKVNGTLTVPGIAIAHHRQMHNNLLPVPRQAWELFQEIRNQQLFPLQVTIENSRAVHILAKGRDLTEEIKFLTNKSYDLMLTEMAFSTNTSMVPDTIDWTKNSQLNEGSIGIHIGMGEGLTGAHIDFICPDVQLIN